VISKVHRSQIFIPDIRFIIVIYFFTSLSQNSSLLELNSLIFVALSVTDPYLSDQNVFHLVHVFSAI